MMNSADVVYSDYTPKLDFYLKSLKNVFECFRFDTLEEIEDALKKKASSNNSEDMAWAKKTLADLNSKSKKVQQITLKMLQKSIDLSYRDTVQMEYRVGCRRSLDEDFINYNPSNNSKKISDSHLESYFQPLQEDLKISEIGENHHKNALYPRKDFLELPGTVLQYLNATNDSPFRNKGANNPQINLFLSQM